MASFKDRSENQWRVQLDPPLVSEIKSTFGINLANLETDPLLLLRNDPMVLVDVIQVVCQEQMDQRKIDAVAFGRSLKFPPDEMLDAIRDAVIDFFPSGRSSHVRDQLEKFDQMAKMTDQITNEKTAKVIADPKLLDRISRKADRVIAEEIDKILRDGPEA